MINPILDLRILIVKNKLKFLNNKESELNKEIQELQKSGSISKDGLSITLTDALVIDAIKDRNNALIDLQHRIKTYMNKYNKLIIKKK